MEGIKDKDVAEVREKVTSQGDNQVSLGQLMANVNRSNSVGL